MINYNVFQKKDTLKKILKKKLYLILINTLIHGQKRAFSIYSLKNPSRFLKSCKKSLLI